MQKWTPLIGNAAHTTSAYMSMGGGIALQNAAVLGQCISTVATLPEALHTFTERRFERAKLVIDTSVRLGELEREKSPPSENRALLTKAFMMLGQPN